MNIRGLHNFINKFATSTRHKPNEIIANEIFKIKKVLNAKKVKNYEKKKSIAKLCFINMMGYQTPFGFSQIIDLLCSPVRSEKLIGSMATIMACLAVPGFCTVVIPELKKLLADTQHKETVILALIIASSIDVNRVADSLGPTVADIAINHSTSDEVRMKAIFCLSRIYKSTQQLPVVDKVAPRVHSLLRSRNLSVLYNCSQLALSLIQTQATALESCFPIAIDILRNLIVRKECPKEYFHEHIPCPFLCANLFKLLAYKVTWEENEIAKINEIMKSLMEMSKGCEAKKHSIVGFIFIFSEASKTCSVLHLPEETMKIFIPLLTKFAKKTAFATEALANIIQSSPKYIEALQETIPTLIRLIMNDSVSVASRALHLLFYVSNKDNCQSTIETLLPFVKCCPLKLRAELCVKLAIFTQSFAPDVEWKAKTLMTLIEESTDMSHLIWNYAADAIIEDKKNLKEYASKLFSKVETKQRLNTGLMKVATYVIGIECPSSPLHVCEVLMCHFNSANAASQAAIISCLLKIAMNYSEVKEEVVYFFDETVSSPYFDVSQRSREARNVLLCNLLPPNILTAPKCYIDTTISLGSQNYLLTVDPIMQFLTGSEGSVYSEKEITVHAKVADIDTKIAKVTMMFRIENNTDRAIKINKFEVDSNDQIRSKIDSDYLVTIDSKKQETVTVMFIAMKVFSELPKVVVGFDSIKEITFTAPVLPKYFMRTFEITKEKFSQIWLHTKDPGLSNSIQLILPDGDVILEADKTVRKWMNIAPLKIEGSPNSLFFSGSFATFKSPIGILLRFVFDEDEMMLQMNVHSTSAEATQEITKLSRHAFPQFETA